MIIRQSHEKMYQDDMKTALVMPGGGARGAFQVGVLKAVSELLPRACHNPFPIISGTSAGAVNSLVLASASKRFHVGVTELEHVWGNFRSRQVFRADSWTMLRSSLHWMASIVLGGTLVGTPRSLLNNSPLRELLKANVRFPLIDKAIREGDLHALAVTAAGYGTARSTTFFQATGETEEWTRKRRVGIRQPIDLDHVMASIAVPMIFPPVQIKGEYFGDGAMRQATPLSPAIHLGADRILVIGIRDETGDPAPDPSRPQPFPSFAQIAGYMLDTLFMDGLYSDLERMTRINELIDSVPVEHRSEDFNRMRPIDTMIVLPSKDLRDIAHKHRRAMPMAVRALLRGISGKGGSENRLLSFLLFEQPFTRELIELGYHDAMQLKDELQQFVTGKDVPRLVAPERIKNDLLGL
jgi:NTE family protein